MTDIGELVVRIKADAAQLEREMKKAQGVVDQSTKKMGGSFDTLKRQMMDLAPALTVGALVAYGKHAVDTAGHLNDLAAQIGFTASTLSALEPVLAQNGSSVDEFAASVTILNDQLGGAAKGNQEAIQAFDSLGLSVKKLLALSPQDRLNAVTIALAGIGDQATRTEAGRNLLGRGFAKLNGVLDETKGNLLAVQEQLSEEKLKRIDEFGDSLTKAAIGARNEFLKLLSTLLEINDAVVKTIAKPTDYATAKVGYTPQQVEEMNRQNDRVQRGLAPDAPTSSERPASVGYAVFQGKEQFGPGVQGSDARGSNKGLLKDDNAKKIADAKAALADFNKELAHQHEFAGMAPRDAAAQKVYYDTLALAQKAGIKDAESIAEANAQVARSTYDLAEAQSEAARFSAELKDQFAATAGDIIFNSKSAGDAIKGLAEELAKMIAKRYILGPLTDSLFGSPGSGGGGLASLFGGFFADGGSPPVGIPSMVGENGPELFVPNSAGTVIPNHALGGTSVTVYQTFNMQPGLAETVGAAIRQATPSIASAAHASVFKALQNGGSESRIAGLRN